MLPFPADPGVKVIAGKLKDASRILVPGDVPLSALAGTAYGEMMAFSALLAERPDAAPEGLSGKTAAALREKLVKSWKDLAADDRNWIAGTPGVWIICRTLLRHGTDAEKREIRSRLAGLARPKSREGDAAGAGAPAAGEASEIDRVAKMSPEEFKAYLGKKIVQANTLQMMNGQSFNTYMWSRGFQGWTPMGKF